MKNYFEDVWVLKERDWHEYVPHHYHITQIGVGHQDLNPNTHYGPDLRQAWYRIKKPVEMQVGSKGNLAMGTLLHAALQDIQKKNVPNSIIEFPMFGKHEDITYSGSIDIVEFVEGSFNPIRMKIIDIKSASDHTLPKHETDYNPTYFAQLILYTYILKTFYLIDVEIDKLEIWYVNKHNLATHKIRKEYDHEEGKRFFEEFLSRCHYLDECIFSNTLPDREPMKWCIYCDWRMLCTNNCVSEEDVIPISESDVEDAYRDHTGKNPYWRGQRTKSFIAFRAGYKIE